MKDNILNFVLLRLAQSYEGQIPFYKRMDELARAQAECLQLPEIDPERLLEFIYQRQETIEKLEGLNQEITGLKKEIQESLELQEFTISAVKQRLSGEGVEALDKVIGDLTQLLGRIKELDKKNEEVLRSRIQETKDKLSQLNNAKAADKAYKPLSVTKDGVFLDFKK